MPDPYPPEDPRVPGDGSWFPVLAAAVGEERDPAAYAIPPVMRRPPPRITAMVKPRQPLHPRRGWEGLAVRSV